MICAWRPRYYSPSPSCSGEAGLTEAAAGSAQRALDRYEAKGAAWPAARVREWLSSKADRRRPEHG